MRIADIAANKIKLICDDNSMNWSCRILFRRITWNKKMDSAGQILMIGLIFIPDKEEMVIWISWYKIVWNSEMDIPWKYGAQGQPQKIVFGLWLAKIFTQGGRYFLLSFTETWQSLNLFLIVNLYFTVCCFWSRFSALLWRKLLLRGCPKNRCSQSVANFFLKHSWRVSCIFSKLARWRTVLTMNTFTETLQEFCVDVRQSCTVF